MKCLLYILICLIFSSANADYWDALKIIAPGCGAAFFGYTFFKKQAEVNKLEEKHRKLFYKRANTEKQINELEPTVRKAERGYTYRSNIFEPLHVQRRETSDHIAQVYSSLSQYAQLKDDLQKMTKKTIENDKKMDAANKYQFNLFFFGTGTAVFTGITLWGIKEALKKT
jgi:hypothetical protein